MSPGVERVEPPSITLRVATYNILRGGVGRVPAITAMIRRTAADIIALQEVNSPAVLEEIACQTGMDYLFAPAYADRQGRHLALLTCLPVSAWTDRRARGALIRPLLEAEIDLRPLWPVPPPAWARRLRLFVVHLVGRFFSRRLGEPARRREIEAVIRELTARSESAPDVILGDFNAVAPGDPLDPVGFLDWAVETTWRPPRRRERQQATDALSLSLHYPRVLAMGRLVGRAISRNQEIYHRSRRFAAGIPRRDAIDHLARTTGYIDCYRALHPAPERSGFTVPTWRPIIRVDYIFAHPLLAQYLRECRVVGAPSSANGHDGAPEAVVASDHYPVCATFVLQADARTAPGAMLAPGRAMGGAFRERPGG